MRRPSRYPTSMFNRPISPAVWILFLVSLLVLVAAVVLTALWIGDRDCQVVGGRRAPHAIICEEEPHE